MTYKVFAYGGPHNDEILDGEFDNFDDALNEMRKEWGGWPRRLEMPDGTNYKFPKGGEWKLPVIYKYFALRTDIENFTANQNYLLREILDNKDIWKVVRLWKKKPVSWHELIGYEKEDYKGIMETFIKLLGYGLLEEALFADGSGFIDRKWR
jgi:hypothetical protein